MDQFNRLPEDQYHHDDFEWLADGLGSAWGKWLTEDALSTLKSGGYYTQLAQTGLRIVAVNSQMGDPLNFYLFLNDNQQETQLQWLSDTLGEAEENGEKVIIIGHIPPAKAAPSALNDWCNSYLGLINRFQATIVGQFYGHTHEDEVRLRKDSNTVSLK